MPLVYEDTLNVAGELNSGGMRRTIAIAPLRDFATIDAAPDVVGVPGATVTIAGTHTFNATKGFVKIQCIPESVQYDDEANGEVGSKGQTHKLMGTLAGTAAENEEILAWLKNDEVIALAINPDGTVQQIGTEHFPARVTKKGSTGTIGAGKRQSEIEVTAYQDRKLFYTGTITYKP